MQCDLRKLIAGLVGIITTLLITTTFILGYSLGKNPLVDDAGARWETLWHRQDGSILIRLKDGSTKIYVPKPD